MITRLLHGLRITGAWHRMMLATSPCYRRICHALAGYLTTGYWDLRPSQDDNPY